MVTQTTKHKKKKYKALILDVDGTLIPNKRDGMPSARVTESITKASKFIHIGVATSRPYFLDFDIPRNYFEKPPKYRIVKPQRF